MSMAIYAIIEAVIFLIPIGTLVWRMAILSANVEQNRKDIKEIKAEHKQNIDNLTNKIDSLIGSVNEIKISIAEIKAHSEEKNEK